MNLRLASGDETLMPLLAGAGSQPEADTDSGIGGTFGATFAAVAIIERIAKIASVVISGGGGGGGSFPGGGGRDTERDAPSES